MNQHDSTHAEACRLTRAAQAARAKGDEQTATKLETKALSMVGATCAPSRRQEARQRILGRSVAALVALALLALPGAAQAAGPRKPVVCMAYELVQAKNGGERGAICYDGKRPKYLVVVGEMVIKDPEAPAPVRVVVGFP